MRLRAEPFHTNPIHLKPFIFLATSVGLRFILQLINLDPKSQQSRDRVSERNAHFIIIIDFKYIYHVLLRQRKTLRAHTARECKYNKINVRIKRWLLDCVLYNLMQKCPRTNLLRFYSYFYKGNPFHTHHSTTFSPTLR